MQVLEDEVSSDLMVEAAV